MSYRLNQGSSAKEEWADLLCDGVVIAHAVTEPGKTPVVTGMTAKPKAEPNTEVLVETFEDPYKVTRKAKTK